MDIQQTLVGRGGDDGEPVATEYGRQAGKVDHAIIGWATSSSFQSSKAK